jgi:hypothetical protein
MIEQLMWFCRWLQRLRVNWIFVFLISQFIGISNRVPHILSETNQQLFAHLLDNSFCWKLITFWFLNKWLYFHNFTECFTWVFFPILWVTMFRTQLWVFHSFARTFNNSLILSVLSISIQQRFKSRCFNRKPSVFQEECFHWNAKARWHYPRTEI